MSRLSFSFLGLDENNPWLEEKLIFAPSSTPAALTIPNKRGKYILVLFFNLFVQFFYLL